MEARAERMQVGEGLLRIGRHRGQRDPREQQVAPFVEQGRGKTQQGVAGQEMDR